MCLILLCFRVYIHILLQEDVQTLRKSKFATLRSAKLISKEQEEYSKENNMYEQLSGYKRLRQQHHKELQSVKRIS